MSLANGLRSKEESIVLSIWVVHFESFRRRTKKFFAKVGVVKSVTHVSFPMCFVNVLSGRSSTESLELAISLVKLAR